MGKSKTYPVEMDCSNCKDREIINVEKGVLVKDFDGECPNCGCTGTLSRASTRPLPNKLVPPVDRWYPSVPYRPYPYPYTFWYGSPGEVGVTYSVKTSDNTAGLVENLPDRFSVGMSQ